MHAYALNARFEHTANRETWDVINRFDIIKTRAAANCANGWLAALTGIWIDST